MKEYTFIHSYKNVDEKLERMDHIKGWMYVNQFFGHLENPIKI